MHIYSCDAIKDEFMKMYSKDFQVEITGGRQMKTFLGMQREQTARLIKIHLDHYIKEVVAEYVEYIRKAIRPKKVPIAPNVRVVLRPEDTPDLPDPRKQRFYRSFVEASVRSHMGQIRYRLRCVTAGSVGRIFALGAPPHSILGRHP